MARRAEMARGVFVLRRIAAADLAARFAQTQMHPSVPRLETILAALRAGRDFPHLIEMCAFTSSHILLPLVPLAPESAVCRSGSFIIERLLGFTPRLALDQQPRGEGARGCESGGQVGDEPEPGDE